MTYKMIFSTLALLAVAGCAQHLSEEDRALLVSTQQSANDAKNQATQASENSALATQIADKAAQDAAKSSQSAAASAKAAQNAGEKADRIFTKGSDK